jgi:hypothetical protein
MGHDVMRNKTLAGGSSHQFGPLLTPAQALAEPLSPPAQVYAPVELAAIREMARFSVNYLTAKHPDLGRLGPICPFMAGALQRDMLTITAFRLEATDEAILVEALASLRRIMVESGKSDDSRDHIFRSIIVTFPLLEKNQAPSLIEKAQRQLKPDFLREGLMIGEFYPDCPTPGLHNASFRALQAPVTSIAMRQMTVQDAPFMLQNRRHIELYEDHFGDEGRRRIQDLLDARDGCPMTRITDTNSALLPQRTPGA